MALCNLSLLLIDTLLSLLSLLFTVVGPWVREPGALTTTPKAMAMLPLSSLFAGTGGGADHGGLTPSIVMGERQLNDKGGRGLKKGGGGETTTAAVTDANGGGRQQRQRRQQQSTAAVNNNTCSSQQQQSAVAVNDNNSGG